MVDRTTMEYKINRALALLQDREDGELDKMYEWMENAFRSQWSLPKELVSDGVKWVHRVTSTDPHDAIRASTRTLSSVMPKITLYPTRNNPESREMANHVERILKWQFQQASERRNTALLADIVLSALLYDEVIISVWSLDEHIRYLESLGYDAKRVKNARRYGRFVIKVHNPRDAIVEYSDMMPERIVFRETMKVQQAIDYWGEAAADLEELHNTDPYKEFRYVTIYDYSELGHRGVFAYFQEDLTGYPTVKMEGAIEILNDDTKYDFFPIAARVGGTSLTNEQRFQRIPMLWSIYNSGQWDTQNILETLLVSEGLAYSVTPRYAVENEYDNDDIDIDFRDPARVAVLKKGQRLQELRPPDLNRGLDMLATRVGDRMGKSTVSKVLQSADYMTAEAFSSLNLATQQGVKAITPYKKLAESALAEAFTIMLYWIDYTKSDFSDYVPSRVLNHDDNGNPLPALKDSIEEITLKVDQSFDVENIYLECELIEDVPTDFVAKINAAGMLVERLRGSYTEALEWVGKGDAETTLKLRDIEEVKFAENAAETQRVINETSIENMQMQQELAKKIEELTQLQQQIEMFMQQAQAQGGGQGGGVQGMQPGQQSQVPGGVPGEPIAPDGSVSPGMQNRFAATRGNVEQPSPFIESNPAEGDISPVQAAPGVGLREEAQQVSGEGG